MLISVTDFLYTLTTDALHKHADISMWHG